MNDDQKFFARCDVCQFIWPARDTREEAEADKDGSPSDPVHLRFHYFSGPIQISHSEVMP